MGFGRCSTARSLPLSPRSPAPSASRRASGLKLLRQFDAAATSRRTRNWKRPQTDADAESWRARARLRASGHDLVATTNILPPAFATWSPT
jgi:hypothetical protein